MAGKLLPHCFVGFFHALVVYQFVTRGGGFKAELAFYVRSNPPYDPLVLRDMLSVASHSSPCVASLSQGSYHQDPMNQLIHFFFVPAIWWSFVVLFSYLPFGEVLGHRVSWGTITMVIYIAYYSHLDPSIRTAAYSVVLILMYSLAYQMVSWETVKRGEKAVPRSQKGFAWKFALGLNVSDPLTPSFPPSSNLPLHRPSHPPAALNLLDQSIDCQALSLNRRCPSLATKS